MRVGRKVAVIGYALADRLYPFVDPLDQEIKVDGRKYTVVGVFEEKKSATGGNFDNYVLVPISAWIQAYGLRDSDGNLIETLDPPYHFKDMGWHHSLKIDLTDDYFDPRRGVRFDLRYQDVPPGSTNDADFYRIDAGMTLYIPFRSNDTLALNYYRSDAHVTDAGNVDPDAIRIELGTNCAPDDLDCLSAEQNLVDMFINERTYGTATTLGGDNRLRAYPQGRFSGGHMAFAGAESRWNFVQDAKPFDYYIWKDVTTTLQVAFSIEVGTVAETPSKLWDDYRTSYGIGTARMVFPVFVPAI